MIDKKNKFKKWVKKLIPIMGIILSIVYLAIGITQIIKGPGKLEPLKSDFSNLSSETPVTAIIQDIEYLNLQYKYLGKYESRHKYYVIKVNNTKILLDSTNSTNLATDKIIYLTNVLSSHSRENETEIRNKAVSNVTNNDLKMSEEEAIQAFILFDYSYDQKLLDDYWGWLGLFFSVITNLLIFGYYGKKYKKFLYFWKKRKSSITN